MGSFSSVCFSKQFLNVLKFMIFFIHFIALKIPPRFTVGLEPRLSVPQGSPINLNCSAIGQPTPTLDWYKDNRPLRNEHPYSIQGEDGDSLLRIQESKKTDAGTYSCRAQNPQGKDTTSCKVHIEG